MMRLAGLLAVLLIGALPILMLPALYTFYAAIGVAAICAAALLLPSLAVAVMGSIAILVVFAVSSLVAPGSGNVVEAILLGMAILTLLDAVHFDQRFAEAGGRDQADHHHLLNVSVSVLVCAGIAVAVAALAIVFSQAIELSPRSFIAAFGGIMVIVACVRRATT